MSAPIIYYSEYNETLIKILAQTSIEQLAAYFDNLCDYNILFKNSSISFKSVDKAREYQNNGRVLRSIIFETFGREYMDEYNNYTLLIVNKYMVDKIRIEYIKRKKSYLNIVEMFKKHSIIAKNPSLHNTNLRNNLYQWYAEEQKLGKSEVNKIFKDYNEYLMYAECYGSAVFVNFDSQHFIKSFNNNQYENIANSDIELSAHDIYKIRAKIANNYKNTGDCDLIFITNVAGEYSF